MTLSRYLCTYTELDEFYEFECWADDEDHSKEQCQNAYPNCEVTDIRSTGEAWND